MITDFASLVQALQTDGATLAADPPAGVLKIPISDARLDSVLWLRWDLEHALLHLMLPLPEPIASDRLPAIESLITHLNHRLVMPGFGLDHEHCTAYFRLSVPRGASGELPFAEVRKLLRTAIQTTRDFAPLFRAVAEEGRAVPEALAMFREQSVPRV